MEKAGATAWQVIRTVPSDRSPKEEIADVQYSFALREVYPADLSLANYWTLTPPGSVFRQQQFLNVVLEAGFASL
jgi:arylamine N-acetyltransferase